MALADAPMLYLATNAGAAIGICLIFALVCYAGDRRLPALVIAALCLALLAASFAGPGVDNVHRWIALGPVRLHTGSLVLPMLLVILPCLERRMAFAAIAVAAILVALQPDNASAFALCAASMVLFAIARDRWTLSAVVMTAVALGVSINIPAAIPPVRFVEHVVGDASAIHPLLSLLMGISIFVAALAPVQYRRRWTKSGIVWSACLIAYFLASFAGHYPTPLLGYGISPILGFGLALALLVSFEGRDNDSSTEGQ